MAGRSVVIDEAIRVEKQDRMCSVSALEELAEEETPQGVQAQLLRKERTVPCSLRGIAGSGEAGDVLASPLSSQDRRVMPVCKTENSILPVLVNSRGMG